MTISDAELRALLNELIESRDEWMAARDELGDVAERARSDEWPPTKDDLALVQRVLRRLSKYATSDYELRPSSSAATLWRQACEERYGVKQPSDPEWWTQDDRCFPDEVTAAIRVDDALSRARELAMETVNIFAIGSTPENGSKEIIRAWRNNGRKLHLSCWFGVVISVIDGAIERIKSGDFAAGHLLGHATQLLKIADAPLQDIQDDASDPTAPQATAKKELGKVIYELRTREDQPSMAEIQKTVEDEYGRHSLSTLTRILKKWCKANNKRVPDTRKGRKPSRQAPTAASDT